MVSCTQSYDALGLPATRTAEDGTVTTVTGDYDYMGRRIFKKVETTVTDPETEKATSVILNHRYLYRGYLQIAALDLTRTTLNALWYICGTRRNLSPRVRWLSDGGQLVCLRLGLDQKREWNSTRATEPSRILLLRLRRSHAKGQHHNPLNGAARHMMPSWGWYIITFGSIIPWMEGGLRDPIIDEEDGMCTHMFIRRL